MISHGDHEERARTFHFPGDSTVVHFIGTAAEQLWLVQASSSLVKRRESYLLCSWNQRGDTESICLWREGTAVVHMQGKQPEKSTSLLRLLLARCAQNARQGYAQWKPECAERVEHSATVDRVIVRPLGSYWVIDAVCIPNGYSEDVSNLKSSLIYGLIRSVPSTRRLVAYSHQNMVHPHYEFAFFPRSVAGDVMSVLWCARRRSATAQRRSGGRAPRLPGTTQGGKKECLRSALDVLFE